MYTDEEKHAGLVQMAEILEAIDNTQAVAAAIPHLLLSDVSDEVWNGVQRQEETVAVLLDVLRQMVIAGSKLMDNDAVLSHIDAVIAAE